MFATQTKPAMNKDQQKRLDAKNAKRLKFAANSSFVLSPSDATMYRALAARCNDNDQDRPDISSASKELCREFSVPSQRNFKRFKRLVSYLAGMPRLVHHYDFQKLDDTVNVYVDTDVAGSKETRRSTSGGAVMIGSCCVKHWAKTQTTMSLSSVRLNTMALLWDAHGRLASSRL